MSARKVGLTLARMVIMRTHQACNRNESLPTNATRSPSSFTTSARKPGSGGPPADKDLPRGKTKREAPASDSSPAVAAGAHKSLEELVLAHRQWVSYMAHRYSRVGISKDDLLAEGMLGLLKAAQRFDPSLGVKFQTYARYWVRAYILSYISENSRVVAAPETRIARRLRLHLGDYEREMTQAAGGPVTDQAMADHIGITIDELRSARNMLTARDVPVMHTEPQEGQQGYEPMVTSTPEHYVEKRERTTYQQGLAKKLLSKLSPREEKIVRARVLAERSTTLCALGNELGISRERVRQIQARAITKMREAATQIMGTHSDDVETQLQAFC